MSRKHYFAPGTLEYHRVRHLRHAARWMGRVLALLLMAAVVTAGLSLLGGK